MMSFNYVMVLFSFRYSRLYQVHYKKQEALPYNPVVHIYISRINKKLVFKIKDGCMIVSNT